MSEDLLFRAQPRAGQSRRSSSGMLAAQLLAAVLLLDACSHEAPKPPPRPTQSLVGTTKEQLLACAGPPARNYHDAGLEYLSYRMKTTVGEGYLQSTPTIPVIGSLAMGGKGYEIVCEANIVIKAGTIVALALASQPVQGEEQTKALCAPVLASCLSP